MGLADLRNIAPSTATNTRQCDAAWARGFDLNLEVSHDSLGSTHRPRGQCNRRDNKEPHGPSATTHTGVSKDEQVAGFTQESLALQRGDEGVRRRDARPQARVYR